MQTPAEIVIERFDGIKAVAEAMGLERSTVQRWGYPHPKGTGGIVPQKHWPRLLAVASARNIPLQANDLIPSSIKAA